jgi:flavin reductase (DIM6/NTAB) family NADH-FMN oxidoreductase RutF
MARKNFGAKPLCYPQPVFIIAAYGENDVPSAMNAAWGGISDFTEITLDLSKGHRTVKDLRARGAFTVSMGTRAQMVACDYVGVVSGNKVPDKVARAGWTVEKSAFVDAPLIRELPLSLECRLVSYDEETGILKGEIVNVSADESILDADGNIDVALLAPITFDPFNNRYLVLGEAVGNAFKDGLALGI